MPRIKLSPEMVAGIRYGRENEKLSLGELSQLYNVSRTQIWRIINSKQWKSRPAASSLRSQAGPEKHVYTLEEVLEYLIKNHDLKVS